MIALVAGVALLLMPAMKAAREATSVMHCTNMMKQISLAIRNYHDTYGHLPPCSIVDSDGKRFIVGAPQLHPTWPHFPRYTAGTNRGMGCKTKGCLTDPDFILKGPPRANQLRACPGMVLSTTHSYSAAPELQSKADYHVDYMQLLGLAAFGR